MDKEKVKDLSEAPREKAEQPGTIKQGTEFTFMNKRVKVHQIDLPRLTLQLIWTKKRTGFHPSLRGQILEFGGHSFFVKAVSGKRLYLLLVEVTEKETTEESTESNE